MDKTNINVEMTFALDKNIYTASNFEWFISDKNKNPQPIKNFETFFDYHVIEKIANDYAIIKREADRTPENVEAYQGIIKVLENIIPDIRNSIQYNLLSEHDNIETVQVKFNFGYYQQQRTPEQLFNTLVMVAGINRFKDNLKMVANALKEQQPYNQNINMEVINNKVKQWEYVISFFENIKYTVKHDLEQKKEIINRRNNRC